MGMRCPAPCPAGGQDGFSTPVAIAAPAASRAWARPPHVISGSGLVAAADAVHVRQGDVDLAVPDRHSGRVFLISASSTERP
jgi:hypothetical protein